MSGKDGSWMTNTFTTHKPSLVLLRATLKNRVLPRLQWTQQHEQEMHVSVRFIHNLIGTYYMPMRIQ